MYLKTFKMPSHLPVVRHLKKEAELKIGDPLVFTHHYFAGEVNALVTGFGEHEGEPVAHVALQDDVVFDSHETEIVAGILPKGTVFRISRPLDCAVTYPWNQHCPDPQITQFIHDHGAESFVTHKAALVEIIQKVAKHRPKLDVDYTVRHDEICATIHHPNAYIFQIVGITVHTDRITVSYPKPEDDEEDAFREFQLADPKCLDDVAEFVRSHVSGWRRSRK